MGAPVYDFPRADSLSYEAREAGNDSVARVICWASMEAAAFAANGSISLSRADSLALYKTSWRLAALLYRDSTHAPPDLNASLHFYRVARAYSAVSENDTTRSQFFNLLARVAWRAGHDDDALRFVPHALFTTRDSVRTARALNTLRWMQADSVRFGRVFRSGLHEVSLESSSAWREFGGQVVPALLAVLTLLYVRRRRSAAKALYPTPAD